MAIYNLNIDGRTHSVDVDSATPLLYVLTDDLALRGPKFGCGLGQCGSCTVIADGRAIRSCITPVERVADSNMTSLEGLGTRENPHPIQEAFIDEQAIQCGFCANGVILTAEFVHARAQLRGTTPGRFSIALRKGLPPGPRERQSNENPRNSR